MARYINADELIEKLENIDLQKENMAEKLGIKKAILGIEKLLSEQSETILKGKK